MNARTTIALCVLAAVPLLAMADDGPKLSCIKDITFNQEFLAKYPQAPAACREVVMKDGQKWARFDATVVKMQGGQVTADFIDNYRQTISRLTFAFSPDARVTVDGKQEKFSQMARGDTLSFWVPASRMGFYAQPGATQSQKLALVSDAAAKNR